MSETPATERKPRARLRLRAGPVLAVLCVLVLALVGTQLRPLILTATFFQAMNRVPEWGAGWDDVGETPALCRAEVAARFLLEQPEPERRRLISAYTRYTLARRRVIDNYNCTMRRYVGSIHQLPDDYPQKNFRTFILLRLLFDAPETHLWPLGVGRDRLVLEDSPDTWGGSYYDGLAEYDNFSARFPWRPADELGCGATVVGR